LPLLLAAFCGEHGLAFPLTKSLLKDDALMLLEAERKPGVNLTPMKGVFSRFL
jgi:hypothetical protein